MWLPQTWWYSNVSSAAFVNLKNVPLTFVMNPRQHVVDYIHQELYMYCSSLFSRYETTQSEWYCTTDTGQTAKHVKFNPSDCSICLPLGCNGRECTEVDSVPAAGPLSLSVCVIVCECVCVSRSTRGSHQAWLRVIHTDEFHCSLSPLIVRGNKPVERAAARGGWRTEGPPPPHLTTAAQGLVSLPRRAEFPPNHLDAAKYPSTSDQNTW